MSDRDKWRHVRAVLAKRTPDSELLVHRAGGEIVAVVGEVMARVMVLRVPEGIPQARADADLDALSVLWNVADELLADADALAGARAEIGRLRAKAETVIDVLDKMKSLAAHAEEMTPMLTEAAIWWADMVALVETALGCAERMTAPEREGATDGNG